MAEKYQEIETMADLKKNDGTEGSIVFDNKGNMVKNDRQYRRDFKRLWRAVEEGRGSIRYYTQRTNRKLGKTALRKKNKTERQNRRKGRINNGK